MGITPDLLANLRALGSQPVSSENGTSYDIGPIGHCKTVILITVNGGTLTAHLEQSDDESSWYDVPGSNFLDPADGAVMDGTGLFEVDVNITMRYVRVVGVVATGAVTWSCHVGVIK